MFDGNVSFRFGVRFIGCIPMNTEESPLAAQDREELRWAYRHLEHPSFAARLSNVIGTPIEQGVKLLPQNWYQRLNSALEASIRKLLDMSITSMGHIPPNIANDSVHKLMVMGTGSFGGFFGPLTLLAELPITTTIMLRSIADIAHSQGEDLDATDARVACMQVFALGARSKADDAADAGYYGLRISLGFHFSSALLYTGNGGVANIPAGIALVRAIASRFGVVFSESAAAKMIPVAGAVSGALVNLLFMQHFQDVARGHFIVRRLERHYGSEVIRSEYERLTREEAEAEKEFSQLEGW
jgi:hypothetical protein